MTGSIALAFVLAAPVRCETVDYRGWAGSCRMTNGAVDVVVVPCIGRIMRYGRPGGPNVLWENPELVGKTAADSRADWANFGGDKLWPAPQSRWGWPPDAELDGSRHSLEVLSDGRVRMTSPASAKTGIRYVRELALAARGSEFTIRNTMLNTGKESVEWSVWEVAQVDDPDEAELALSTTGRFARGFYTFPDSSAEPPYITKTRGTLIIRRNPGKALKVGTDAPRGVLRSRRGRERFEVSAKVEAHKTYPDEGCSQEVYTSPDPLRYVELELLSQVVRLDPGKQFTFTTRWRLTDVR